MKYIWRSVLALTGILILVWSAPHNSPWAMKYIKSNLDCTNTLISVDFWGSEFMFSLSVLWQSTALMFVGIILVTLSARKAAKTLIRQPKQLLFLILSLAYLLFTLRPSTGSWEMVLYMLLGALGIAMILIGASRPIDSLILLLGELGHKIEQMFYAIPAWKLLVSLFSLAFTATNLACYFIFEHIPHIVDSVDQVFHGKIFLLGKLTVPSPEPREFFDVLHMINNGKWYSQYPPGHSLLFSIGHIFRAPWIINPLFGSLCVVLLYFVAKEMYNERIGRMAALLGTLSPLLIFMSSGFMNHTTTLFFVGLFMLGFARIINKSRIRDALLAGFALGYALNIRPMTAIAIGSPFAVYAMLRLAKLTVKSKQEALRFGILCVITIAMFGIMSAMLLSFNYITNGDPLVSGYVMLHGKNHNPGFGPRGLFMGTTPYTPRHGLIQMARDLNALNKYLFEIPIPSLLLVSLALISPGKKIWDWLLISSALSLVFAYFFYWCQCWGFGPRFIFESTGPLLILAARGISSLPNIANRTFGITDKHRVKGYIAVTLVLCFCLGYASNIPLLIETYSDSYWGVNGNIIKAVKQMNVSNAIVFVETNSGYESVFAENHPLLKSDIIYAKDLGRERNIELMEKFRDRKFFIADGNSVKEYPSEATNNL